METNDSNIKPQPTGGLKIMTVFIVVLALHVIVIGGFTVYHLMSGGSPDTDLADKGSKDLKITPDGAVAIDNQSPDASQADKSPTAPTTPADASGVAATTPTPTADSTASTDNSVSPPTPATTPQTTAPAAPTTVPSTTVASTDAPTAPVTPEPLAPPPDVVPSAPLVSGPVKMPPIEPAMAMASESKPAPAMGKPYVVKITDSYTKIAHQHHITVAELKAANNIKSNTLHAGQKLIIPEKSPMVATAASPETSGNTTILSDVPTGPIMGDATPATVKPVAGTSFPTSQQHHVYTVVKGDTLIRIAHKFKTTATALMTANNITDPTKLGIGKKLKIPSQETRSAKNSAPMVTPAATQPSQVETKTNAPTAQLANFVP